MFYTVPKEIEANKPFFFVYESPFSPDNTYSLRIAQNTFLAKMSPEMYTLSYPSSSSSISEPCFAEDIIGNVYLSLTDGIYKYNKKEWTLFVSMNGVKGFAFDRDNYLYVSYWEPYPRIAVFDSNGTFLYDIFSEWLSSPGPIQRDREGNLYVINEAVLDLPSSSSLSSEYNPNSKYNGSYLLLHIIPNNNTLSGTVNLFSHQGFSKPTSLVFDSNNNGYICNNGNHSISIVDMVTGDTDIYFPAGAGLLHPRWMTIDKKDNLYLSRDTAGTSIQKISKQKRLSLYSTSLSSSSTFFCDQRDMMYTINTKEAIMRRFPCNRFVFHITQHSLGPGQKYPCVLYDDTQDKILLSFELSVGGGENMVLRQSSNPFRTTRRILGMRNNFTRRRR